MDFHFAKHLSPLVLASEREMSFDQCCHHHILPGAVAPVPVLCTGWRGGGGASLNGHLVKGLWHTHWELLHQQMFLSFPAPHRGLLLGGSAVVP